MTLHACNISTTYPNGDSLRYLRHGLVEANTFREFETERAAAEQTDARTGQVTLDVRARKVVVAIPGRRDRGADGRPSEGRSLRPRRGGRRIWRPRVLASIRTTLLIDWETGDNVKAVRVQN